MVQPYLNERRTVRRRRTNGFRRLNRRDNVPWHHNRSKIPLLNVVRALLLRNRKKLQPKFLHFAAAPIPTRRHIELAMKSPIMTRVPRRIQKVLYLTIHRVLEDFIRNRTNPEMSETQSDGAEFVVSEQEAAQYRQVIEFIALQVTRRYGNNVSLDSVLQSNIQEEQEQQIRPTEAVQQEEEIEIDIERLKYDLEMLNPEEQVMFFIAGQMMFEEKFISGEDIVPSPDVAHDVISNLVNGDEESVQAVYLVFKQIHKIKDAIYELSRTDMSPLTSPRQTLVEHLSDVLQC